VTAEAEHAVTQSFTQSFHHRPSTPRPGTARPATAASTNPIGFSKYIPQLLDAIEKERTYAEDEFQAQVCLAWIHWQLGEPALAAGRLPKNIEEDFSQLDGTNKESAEWTKVCALKGSYIKGSAQNRIGQAAEALETFESALPVLFTVSSSQKQGKELRSWTELYLTGFCVISGLAIKSQVSSILESEILSAFRAWAKFWDNQGPAPAGGRSPQAEVPRRHVWREYYITLSYLLQEELPFPTTALTATYAQASIRLQQRAELKRVEARYETLLLNEVQFPKAEEASEEVESFVEVVILNWRILCGSSWEEEDLGEGGSEAVSRGVLDILYRAATKTFHSTAILRHLFTVHLAVAEFDLAFKAFDTYIEIVKKGKARVEKTGEEEQGLDDDETVLKTASECIKALCRYGSQSGAEKAKDLGQFFEYWLDKYYPAEKGSNSELQNGSSTGLRKIITPRTFAMAWRCIGIGHAQWARSTFDAAARGEIQLRAIKCFRNALLPQYESTADVETLFALGTILAERSELSAAIDVVKSGLLPRNSSSATISDDLGPHPGRFLRQRSLVPLWHLMALLLSARQEFVTAARSCEGAFEQFQDPRNLFGDSNLNGAFRSEHLNANEKSAAKNNGVVDDMDDFEKANVLEVKITQLALIEVLEGPEVAVNASDELLSLYSRLFGDPKADQVTTVAPSTPSTAVPPRSSAGTIKSIKGSIFGRSSRRSRSMKQSPSSLGEKSSVTLRPHTAQTTATIRAPMIQVTNANGSTEKKHDHLTKEHGHHDHERLQKRTGSLSSKQGSVRSRSTSAGRRKVGGVTDPDPVTTVDGERFFTPPPDTQHRDQWLNDGRSTNEAWRARSPVHVSDAASVKTTPPNPLPPKSQQMAHKETSLKPTNSDPAVAQDNRLPHVSSHSSSTNPLTKFPQEQQSRRRLTILVQVWLFIAGFYRRANMYEDAKGAIEEAYKLVEKMDADVSKDTTGDVSISHPGWGGGKSIAELWGDIYAAVLFLHCKGLNLTKIIQRGALAVAESAPYTALAQFEFALNNFADHPAAIVGLSNILLDIYTEDLLPAPSMPPLNTSGVISTPSASTLNTSTKPVTTQSSARTPTQTPGPLGLPSAHAVPIMKSLDTTESDTSTPTTATSNLTPSTTNKESSTALLGRLAARDRAYGLLTGLTKLGTGWNYSEAWFALARAYELGGQTDKAREVLWWCVELEEGRAVRGWEDAGGGYVL
jgi:tetratricopeptide (TPR) repeat protein